MAFGFLLSMPGAPFIYYGDEIGMRYVEGLTSVEGGYNRTGSRSPMQWDSTANNGFSSAAPEKLYIRMDDAPDRPTAEAQMADSSSLYHEIKRLIGIRQAHPALQSKGEITFVYAAPKAYPLAYLRSAEDEKILVIVNPSAAEAAFESELPAGKVIYSYQAVPARSGAPAEAKKEGGAWIAPPCSVSFVQI